MSPHHEGVAAITESYFDKVSAVNLKGPFRLSVALGAAMLQAGAGSIINISSLSGTNPFVRGAAYCASKAAVNAFSESLMQEVRYDHIRVSYVAPGSVATEFALGDPAKGAEWKVAPEEVAEVVVNLLRHPTRSLPSRVEIRPTRPPKK
jgi:short-subunit dehydrogenase